MGFWGESQPVLPNVCLKTAVIKKLLKGRTSASHSPSLLGGDTLTFLVALGSSLLFPIASNIIIAVSYALSVLLHSWIYYMSLYYIPEYNSQDTDKTPFPTHFSADLCYLFIWKMGLYQNFPMALWPWSKSELRFNFEHGSWPIYTELEY